MVIRSLEDAGWAGTWAILEPVFRSGESYAVPLDISEEAARRKWTAPPTAAFVAVEPETGRIVGSYYLRPNHDGPGAHVCNCGYVVREDARGQGLASLMCRHSQEEAARRGFSAMQCNLVASSNEGAIRLWTKLGFETVGTLPGAFRHPRLGLVDALVMFKQLRPGLR